MKDFLTELSDLDLTTDLTYYGNTLTEFSKLSCFEGVYRIEDCDYLFGDISEVEEYFEEVYEEMCVDVRTDKRVYTENFILDEDDQRYWTNDDEFFEVKELSCLAREYENFDFFSEYADLSLKEVKAKALYQLLEIQIEEKIEVMIKNGELIRNENPILVKI